VSWQVQEGINFGYCHPFWTIGEFDDLVACANFPVLQNAKVKTGPSVRHEQRGHSRFVHADAYAIAGYTRLCYFEYRVTNAVSITNANLVILKSFNGEILPELSEAKITAPENLLPVSVRAHLVHEYSALLSTVTR